MTTTRGHQLWGGRFQDGPSPLLRRLNDSLSFDRELFPAEVACSAAWAEELARAGALRPAEARRIVRALRAMPAPTGTEDAEDVHAYVEGRLCASLGDWAARIHSGRSRNDQVVTDLKYYLKISLEQARGDVAALMEVIARKALAESATAMPSYTHLRTAEPVTFGHWLLAYGAMLERDADRLAEVERRHDTCPLGSGAVSGTPIAVDRHRLARSLGFAAPTDNSLDAVSDRDMAIDYLHAAAMLLSHLSRLAEDLIFYSADEVGFVELPDAFATGSSRMPHKKNPDVLELVRGQAGRVAGDLAGLLSVMKGLPLAYDKDMQLDKEPVFRTRATLAALLPALGGLLDGLEVRRDAMREAACHDRLLATEVADAMAARGVPFRKAHEIVGRRFALARREGRTLAALGPGDGIEAADLLALDVDRALARRSVHGGTAPRRVARAARHALARVSRATRRRRR